MQTSRKLDFTSIADEEDSQGGLAAACQPYRSGSKLALHSHFEVSRVFGVNISELLSGDSPVPRVLVFLCEFLLEEGKYKEDLFRKAPSEEDVALYRRALNEGRYESCKDPVVVCEMLRTFLRELQGPIIPSSFYFECLKCLENIWDYFQRAVKKNDVFQRMMRPQFILDQWEGVEKATLDSKIIHSIVYQLTFSVRCSQLEDIMSLFFQFPKITKKALEYIGVFFCKMALHGDTNGFRLKDVANELGTHFLRPYVWSASSRKRQWERHVSKRFMFLFLLWIKKKHNLISPEERVDMERTDDEVIEELLQQLLPTRESLQLQRRSVLSVVPRPVWNFPSRRGTSAGVMSSSFTIRKSRSRGSSFVAGEPMEVVSPGVRNAFSFSHDVILDDIDALKAAIPIRISGMNAWGEEHEGLKKGKGIGARVGFKDDVPKLVAEEGESDREEGGDGNYDDTTEDFESGLEDGDHLAASVGKRNTAPAGLIRSRSMDKCSDSFNAYMGRDTEEIAEGRESSSSMSGSSSNRRRRRSRRRSRIMHSDGDAMTTTHSHRDPAHQDCDGDDDDDDDEWLEQIQRTYRGLRRSFSSEADLLTRTQSLDVEPQPKLLRSPFGRETSAKVRGKTASPDPEDPCADPEPERFRLPINVSDSFFEQYPHLVAWATGSSSAFPGLQHIIRGINETPSLNGIVVFDSEEYGACCPRFDMTGKTFRGKGKLWENFFGEKRIGMGPEYDFVPGSDHDDPTVDYPRIRWVSDEVGERSSKQEEQWVSLLIGLGRKEPIERHLGGDGSLEKESDVGKHEDGRLREDEKGSDGGDGNGYKEDKRVSSFQIGMEVTSGSGKALNYFTLMEFPGFYFTIPGNVGDDSPYDKLVQEMWYKYDEKLGLFNEKPPKMEESSKCSLCDRVLKKKNPRHCEYCGRAVCTQCGSRSFLVPHHMLQRGDFSLHRVCFDCEDHLSRHFVWPMIRFNAFSESAIRSMDSTLVTTLMFWRAKIRRFLLFYLLPECPAKEAMVGLIPTRLLSFVVPEEPRISLSDVLQIRNGGFGFTLRQVIVLLTNHIRNCPSCSLLRRFCPVCSRQHANPIPLQGDNMYDVVRCSSCRQYCHVKCARGDVCHLCDQHDVDGERSDGEGYDQVKKKE